MNEHERRQRTAEYERLAQQAAEEIERTRYHHTDLGNAHRLIRQHGPDIRYCHPWGKWLVLHLARRYTGLTLAELGREMGVMNEAGRGMDYAAVSAGLRWFARTRKTRSVTAIERRTCRILNL